MLKYVWIDEIFDRSKIEISDSKLISLYENFTPLYQIENGDIYTIKNDYISASDFPLNLRDRSFTWDKRLGDKVGKFVETHTAKTDHSCGYYGLFKPSIAEILAQINDNKGYDYGNSFYIKMDLVEIFRCGGGHRATTVFGSYSMEA